MRLAGTGWVCLWLLACAGRANDPSRGPGGEVDGTGHGGASQTETPEAGAGSAEPATMVPFGAGAGGDAGAAGEPSAGGARGQGEEQGAAGAGAQCGYAVAASRGDFEFPEACGFVEAETIGGVRDPDELTRLMVGEWLLCGYPSIFGTRDEVGLEITPDLQWYKLEPDGFGGVARAGDEFGHGTLKVVDGGEFLGLSFVFPDGAIAIGDPEFSAVPAKMRLKYHHASEYIRNDPSGLCAQGVAPSGPGPYTIPVECSATSVPQEAPGEIEAARQALVGRWLTCGGSLFYPPGDVGLAIHADGTFQRLYTDDAGEIYAGQGFEREGTYEILDNGDYVQLNLQPLGTGYYETLPEFRNQPRGLVLEDTSYVYAGE